MRQVRSTPGSASGFLDLPSSALGRLTALLFAVVIAAIALMATVVEPAQPAWRGAFAVFIVISIATTAAAGLGAAVFKRERSWAVSVPLALALLLLVNEVLQRV